MALHTLLDAFTPANRTEADFSPTVDGVGIIEISGVFDGATVHWVGSLDGQHASVLVDDFAPDGTKRWRLVFREPEVYARFNYYAGMTYRPDVRGFNTLSATNLTMILEDGR